MIAFNHVVPVLNLSVFNVRRAPAFAFEQSKRATIGGRFIRVDESRDLPLLHVVEDFTQKPVCSFAVTTGGEIKIDSAAPAVDGPVQIRPAAIDLHVGFIHVPRAKIGRVTPVPAQPFFHFRRITLNPAVNRGVIDIHSAFSQHLLQLTVTDAVFAVPAYGPQNDVTLKMPAFEWVHVQLHQQKGMISLSPPTICNSANHSALASIPAHRIARLRRQGERYFTDGLRDITSDRRWAILAVCVVEWEAAIADAIVETHDRIVGKTWREAKRQHDETISGSKATLTDTIRTFTALGASLLEARSDGTPLEMAVASSVAWDRLAQLVATGTQLSNTLADEPLAYVGQGYHRFRRYAPRMLRCLKLEAAPVAGPLVAAALSIGEMKGVASPERRFLRPSSKWNRHLRAQEKGDTRLWEVAVLFHLRDAFRSGDVWLAHSRRYGDLKQVLVPMIAAQENAKLAVPSNPQDWLADRKARLTIALKRLARAARNGTIPHGSIEDGTLRIDRLTADVPDGAEALILDLYRRMPSVRITDMLLEVDAALGFTDAFTHLRTGAPCRDRIGLLNVLLAEGLNLGLRKMAEATNTHDYWQLSRLARWHVESEAMNQALAIVVAAQGKLPMSRVWGMGTSASSDGQFFPTARHGEAMNMVNAKYGSVPGLKAYTHVSDQFAPFACQSIPATVSEAPYILDGLLMNEVGRHVREQYADTAGFTDHLFGASSLLGYNLVLRIRDLPSKRLYVFNPDTTPRELRKLVGGKAREDLIVANWPDIFRCAATMTAGKIRPSQLLRKLASYPRQNNLAVALREVGRIERTLFIIEWILDTDMQRRAQIGLNKGEAHHALKNALRIGRQGEIRDRTTEGQHYRIAGLNLLTAVIIYWNTVHLGHAVTERRNEGLDVPPEFLPHISPLGWAHILLTGEYLWPKEPKA